MRQIEKTHGKLDPKPINSVKTKIDSASQIVRKDRAWMLSQLTNENSGVKTLLSFW